MAERRQERIGDVEDVRRDADETVRRHEEAGAGDGRQPPPEDGVTSGEDGTASANEGGSGGFSRSTNVSGDGEATIDLDDNGSEIDDVVVSGEMSEGDSATAIDPATTVDEPAPTRSSSATASRDRLSESPDPDVDAPELAQIDESDVDRLEGLQGRDLRDLGIAEQPDADRVGGEADSSSDFGERADVGDGAVTGVDLSYGDEGLLGLTDRSAAPGEADLEQMMNQDGVGGLDGRNESTDGMVGAGSGDVGGGRDAMGGMTSDLSGSNSADHQTNMRKIYGILNDPTKTDEQKRAALDAIDVNAEGDYVEFTSGSGYPITVTETEDGTELRATYVQKEYAAQAAKDEGFIGRWSKVFTRQDSSVSSQQLQATDDRDLFRPPEKPAGREDQIEGSEPIRPGMRDPSEGWGDETDERAWELGTGGGVTDPSDDGGGHDSMGSVADEYEADPTGFVAEYLEGETDPTLDGTELDGIDPNAPYY